MTDSFRIIGASVEAETRAIAAVLAQDRYGRILMQIRDDFAHVVAAGRWSILGGAVEGGETLRQAARREFLEETGIALDPGALTPLARFASQSVPGDVIYVFATSRVIDPAEIRLSEGAGFCFLTRAQAEVYPVIPNMRLMLREMPEIGR